MLNKLHIQNIALISECTITFDTGFNVLSGETGAGKSIIIDALNFLLGARGDKTIVKSGEDYAKVEGWFSIDSSLTLYDGLFGLISQPKDDMIFLSRTFGLNGKSECKINGESYPLNILKKVGEYLVDIFGQNDHAFLLDTKQHLFFVDSISSKIDKFKEDLTKKLDELKEIKSRISGLGGEGAERERNIEILKYQINEIESANLKDDEEETLAERKKVLLNAEKIFSSIREIDDISSSANFSVNLKLLFNQIVGLEKYFGDLAGLSDRISSVKYELEDIISEVQRVAGNVEYDENELDFIEERLDYIGDLKRKYGKDILGIKNFLTGAKQKLDDMMNVGEVLAKLNVEKVRILDEIYDLCKMMTAERQKVAVELEKGIVRELKELGMKNADFKVGFLNTYNRENIETLCTQNGCDEVEFMFSANLGEPLKPLSKIISGGEMSRFMLAFKCVLNSTLNKTYVFDEIDTGIGGAVGTVVAKKLASIALHNQVLCITHLAQIACFSDVSFKIEKYEQNNKTYSKINPLSLDEKIAEITRMIGVGSSDEYAKLHAKELVKESETFKKEILTKQN